MLINFGVVAAVTLLTLPTPSPAQRKTGSDLLAGCAAYLKQQDGSDVTVQEAVKGIWCLGYVDGLVDGLALMDGMAEAMQGKTGLMLHGDLGRGYAHPRPVSLPTRRLAWS
jgi:acyl-CoA reductase-like NAD-dependent aldehyde dehydrogenase